MGYEYCAACLRIDEIEQIIAKIHALPSDLREDAFYEITELISYDAGYSDFWAFMSLDFYSNGNEEKIIPVGVREKLRAFLGSFPPLVFLDNDSFQSPRAFGRNFPVLYEFSAEAGHWFLTEEDVLQMREFADFVPALEAHLKILEEEFAKFGPLPEPPSKPEPTGFFARLFRKTELPPMKRPLETQVQDLTYLLQFLAVLISTLDKAIDKKTGLFLL